MGKYHQLSAGLVTGGKKEFKEEQLRVIRMNVLVATPGRLLQHLEQTPGFDVSLLQVLVLDEADRILDLGFSEQLSGIVSYLPNTRQTMLFSATQTRSIRDLARLSLNKATVQYVAVRSGKDECATPAKLVQNYVVCGLERKLDVVLGFIKAHLKSKMIVFFSSCAQVRFVHELFCALQPGTPLLALHGKCKHAKRTQIYLDFLRRPGAVLFATDIAARGLDFPSVDWVMQVDAPEDAEGYIHRVGRTARYTSGGRALLILLPSEEDGMLSALAPKNIPIKKLTINPDKVRMSGSVPKKAAAAVAADPEKKRLAEKAFTSYVRSIQLMHNKEIFRISELPLEEFAVSLGLLTAPRVAGLSVGGNEGGVEVRGGEDVEEARMVQRKKKNVNRSLQRLKEQIKAEKLRKRLEREEKAGTISSANQAPPTKGSLPRLHDSLMGREEDRGESDGESEAEEDGGLVLVKKRDLDAALKDEGGEDEWGNEMGVESLSSRKGKKKMRILRDGKSVDSVAAGARKTLFDDNGVEMENLAPLERFAQDGGRKLGKGIDDLPSASAEYVERVRARLSAVQEEDKARDRERVRDKHLKRRRKEKVQKVQKEGDNDNQATQLATLGSLSDGERSGSDDSEGSDYMSQSDGESESEMGERGIDGKQGYSKKEVTLEEQEDTVLQMLAKRNKV